MFCNQPQKVTSAVEWYSKAYFLPEYKKPIRNKIHKSEDRSNHKQTIISDLRMD